MVEHSQSSTFKKKASSGFNLRPKRGISKKQNFQGKCFNYNKMGHKAINCRLVKKKKNKKTNIIEDFA